MNPAADQAVFSGSQKIYAVLLRAYPRRHRAEYGSAMMQLFRDQCRDAWAEAGGWGMAKLWLRVLPDVVSTSITERLAAIKERKIMNDKITNLNQARSTSATAIFITIFTMVFLLTVILATAVTFILPETYASTCRVKVENDHLGRNDYSYDPYFIQTTFEIINSQLVLSNVIAKLNLNVQWGKKYFNGEVPKTTESMEILRGRLALSPVRNTRLIAITAYSDDRNEAARIANAVAESYQNYAAARRKVNEASLDPRIINDPPVWITDPAEPGRFPVRPNKTLNIVIGMMAGIVLATLAGGLAVWVSTRRANGRVVT